MKPRLLIVLVLLLAGCATNPQPAPTAMPDSAQAKPPLQALTPFSTYTPEPSPTATDPATPTPLPSPSPTPRTHTVTRGEDMGGIAFRYGITLEALMAANPSVNPSAMSVGAVLVIPAGAATPTGQPPTPLPSGVSLGRVTCSATRDNGAVCFVPVTNEQDQAVENVTAVVRMAAPGGQTHSRTATTPLNQLLPGQKTAISVYFPPPLLPPYQVTAELLTALPLQAGNRRYLDAGLQDVRIDVSDDGLSARVQAAAVLNSGETAAQTIWVAATAYGEDGRVIGLRRWENSGSLKPGDSLAVDFMVYSTAGRIERVETLVEARP